MIHPGRGPRTGHQALLKDPVNPLHHAIRLRVVGGGPEGGDAQDRMELSPQSRSELPSLVRSGDAETADPMAGSCNAASGSLVDVDIPELSESPWPGSDIF